MTDRATRLAEKLPEIGADLLVVTSLVNVRYLTGFTGSNAIAVVGPDTRAFVTDFRYVEQSAAEVDGVFERTISPELLETLPGLLPSGTVRLAFEDAHMSVRTHGKLGEIVGERAELVAADHPHVVEHYRAAHAARRNHHGSPDAVDTEELRQAFVHYRALFDELVLDH